MRVPVRRKARPLEDTVIGRRVLYVEILSQVVSGIVFALSFIFDWCVGLSLCPRSARHRPCRPGSPRGVPGLPLSTQ